MQALLAPIPARYIEDGEAIFDQHGRVAYGSKAWDLFKRLEREGLDKNLPVLIYASATESQNLSGKTALHKIVCIAKLDGFEECDKLGKCKKPHLRSDHALETDTSFALFWELIDLKRLEKPASLIGVRTLRADGKAGTKLHEAPRGPMRVWIIEEAISNNF